MPAVGEDLGRTLLDGTCDDTRRYMVVSFTEVPNNINGISRFSSALWHSSFVLLHQLRDSSKGGTPESGRDAAGTHQSENPLAHPPAIAPRERYQRRPHVASQPAIGIRVAPRCLAATSRTRSVPPWLCIQRKPRDARAGIIPTYRPISTGPWRPSRALPTPGESGAWSLLASVLVLVLVMDGTGCLMRCCCSWRWCCERCSPRSVVAHGRQAAHWGSEWTPIHPKPSLCSAYYQ